MSALQTFLRFFVYSFLGIQMTLSVVALFGLGSYDYDTAPGFPNVFMAVMWVPVGALLSGLATRFSSGVRARPSAVALVSLAAGSLFLPEVVLVSAVSSRGLSLLVPCLMFVGTLCLTRLFPAR